jgi:hypothetical protein
VRTGLFVAGAAVTIIGAGVLIASLTLATGPSVTHFDPVSAASIPGHGFYSPQLEGSNQSSASTHLVWASSASLLVAVYPSVECPNGHAVCQSGHAVASWWANSGSWSDVGSLSFPLFLNITNPNGTPVTFSGSLVETYTTSALTNPTWALFLPLIGGVVLVAIGGVGIFLGLFLPRGTFSQLRRSGPYDEVDPDDPEDPEDEGDDLEPPEADEAPPPGPGDGGPE